MSGLTVVRMDEASWKEKGGKIKVEMDEVSTNARTLGIRSWWVTARNREVWKAVLEAAEIQ